MKATDPVCGMQVEIGRGVLRSEYRGQTYYFCTLSCRLAFDAHPEMYVLDGLANVEEEYNGEGNHGRGSLL